MMRSAFVLGLLGLAAATGLFIWHGAQPVFDAFAAAGWVTVGIALLHFLSMALNARSWQILLPPPKRPTTAFFLWAVWLREAVNGLLPVARIGGEVVTARLLMGWGLGSASSVASLIADVTVTLGSQLIFTLIGIALLLLHQNDNPIIRQSLIGVLIFIPLLGGFFLVQRKGVFGMLSKISQKVFGDRFVSLASNAAALDCKIRRLYRRRSAVVACLLWQVAGWCAGGIEIWAGLQALGHPASLTDGIIIESLIQALSSSAFIVPGALGVQEGGFMLLGSLLGINADTALALALIRRARDILLFVPALAFWQISLGHRWLKSN